MVALEVDQAATLETQLCGAGFAILRDVDWKGIMSTHESGRVPVAMLSNVTAALVKAIMA